MLVLAELTPLDPVAGSRVTLRAASADERAITGLNGERWWPAMSETPVLTIRLFEGDFTGDVDVGTASFTVLIDKLARLSANARRFVWAGAGVKIYAGTVLDAWPWTQWFDGLVEGFDAQANRVRLRAKVNTEPFEKDALTATYAGTGGIEGDANLKNKVKPWVFGRALNVEPVLINAVDNVFQFSAYGPIQAVNALYERASDFGASVGDYASYAALVSATIPPGRWATCVAQGLVRLGAPPFGVITGDVDGDKPSGVWIRKTGEIINRIATNAGISSTLIDSASLAALDVAVPYNINLVLTDQTTVLDIVSRLARPCNAQAGVSWLGKLFVTRVAIGSPVITLDAQGRRKPGVISSSEGDVSPPYWRIAMGAQRSWRVHSLDEIATEAPLADRGLYVSTETYREGNIVDLADGSRWKYVSLTPTAGNAPDAVGSVFWENMRPAITGTGSKLIRITADKDFFTYDSTGALSPGAQAIALTASRQNTTGALSWSAEAFNSAGASLGAVTLRTTSSGSTAATNQSTVYLQSAVLPSGTWRVHVVAFSGAPDNISDPKDIGRQQPGANGTGTPGTNAKILDVDANLLSFTFDAGGNAVPSSQTSTITASPQNLTGGAVVWTYEDNLGTASSTLAALLGIGEPDANTRTVDQSVFTATPSRTWLRVKGNGQGAEASLGGARTLVKLVNGSPVLAINLSNDPHSVPANADGSSPNLSGANGMLKVFYGATDVTAAATLSEVSETGCTGSINTATNSPVSGQPKGYYTITAMSADSATYRMQASYDPGNGAITTQKDFTLSKQKQGNAGAPGAGAFTLANVNGTTVGTNSVTSTSNGAWTGLARTIEGFAGGASVTGLMRANTFMGLNTDPATFVSGSAFSSIDYAIHLSNNGNVYKSRNGTLTAIGTWAGSGSLRCSVESDGRTVRYLWGSNVHSEAGSSLTEILYGNFVVSNVADTITEIGFASAGTGGDDGLNAMSIAALPPVHVVQSYADGTPKTAISGFTMFAYVGFSPVTAASTYSFTSSGLSGVSHAGGGVFNVTGMTADEGYVEVSVTAPNGAQQKLRVTYKKVKDAAGYISGEDTTIGTPSSASYAEHGRVELLCGPNGSVTSTFNAAYVVGGGSSAGVSGYLEYSLDGSSWTALTSAVTDGPFPPGEGVAVSGSNTTAGSSLGVTTKRILYVRLMLRKNGTGSLSLVSGNMQVQWTD